MRPTLVTVGSVVLALAVLGLAAGPAGATTINATGDPAHDCLEWGISPGAYGDSSQWTPKAGIFYAADDTPPTQDYVNPGHGGQTFDAEAIYFTRDRDYAYFAVVSGMPPTGATVGGTLYRPGDIAIDLLGDGIPRECGIAVTSHDGLTPGGVYHPLTWQTTAGFPVNAPTLIAGASTRLWHADGANLSYLLVYDGSEHGDYAGNDHYLIEASVPLSALGLAPGNTFSVHWTASCGNNAINLTCQIPPPPPENPPPGSDVPEPATAMLLGGGLLAALIARRRKNARHANAVKS